MTAPEYMVLGAALLLVATILILIVVVLRSRARTRRAAAVPVPQHMWTPPETPAPVEQLASASLEARIAAWVATAPQPEKPMDAPLVEPVSPLREAPTTEPSRAAALPATALDGSAAPIADELEELAVDADPVIPAPEGAASGAGAAPFSARVELWFDGTRVVVGPEDAASERFRHLANELLGDLDRTRGTVADDGGASRS